MEKGLIELGLSEKEARVYVAVLALGSASAGIIAKKAGLKRPNTYIVLENLVKFGLISEIPNAKEKQFKAEQPEKLQRLTKKLRRQAIAAEIRLGELLPELKTIQKHLAEAPKLTFYQGMSGIKNIVEDFSESKNPWYFFGASEEIIKALGHGQIEEVMERTNELRERVGRPMSYYITDKGIRTVKLFRKDNPLAHRMKFLPGTIKPKSAIVAYDNKLAIININSMPFGAVVESREVVELIKLMHQLIWKSLPGNEAGV